MVLRTARRNFKLACQDGALTQAFRYGIAGAVTAAIYSSIYLALVWSVLPGERAFMAVPFAFVTALTSASSFIRVGALPDTERGRTAAASMANS